MNAINSKKMIKTHGLFRAFFCEKNRASQNTNCINFYLFYKKSLRSSSLERGEI